jgi:hypothetical protein
MRKFRARHNIRVAHRSTNHYNCTVWPIAWHTKIKTVMSGMHKTLDNLHWTFIGVSQYIEMIDSVIISHYHRDLYNNLL